MRNLMVAIKSIIIRKKITFVPDCANTLNDAL
jgi:hypothetical protein